MRPECETGRLRDGGVAARIDTRTTGNPGEVSAPVFHLSRHDPAPEPLPDDTLLTRFLTTVDTGTAEDASRTALFERWARTSPVVAARVRDDEVPELVVDRLMSGLAVAHVVGALIDARTCRLGLCSTDRKSVV